MSDADALEMIGYLFLAYAGGWGSGFLIYTFRRLVDQI